MYFATYQEKSIFSCQKSKQSLKTNKGLAKNSFL